MATPNVESFKEWEKNNLNTIKTAKRVYGNTALHVAARSGETSIVQEIIQQQRNLLVSKNFNGDTPMHLAAAAGHTEVIHHLIEGHTMDAAGSERQRRKVLRKALGERGTNGNTPLLSAMRNRRLAVAEILVEKYPQAASICDFDGRSAFSFAVDFKLADILKAIANAMPESNMCMASHLYMRGFAGPTLLHGTILRDDLASMNIVLGSYPKLIKENDNKKRSPLHYAAALGSVKMVERLLELNDSVACEKDKDGKMPTHLAAEYGHTSVLSKLFEKRPDTIELTDGKRKNVVHLAAENGKVDTINYLISLPLIGDLVNQCDKNRCTPFFLAAMNLHTEVVRILSSDETLPVLGYDHCIKALQVLQSVEFEAVSMHRRRNTRTTNGDLESQVIESQDIVDSNYDKTIELQKHSTLNALTEVRERQAQFPEDILDVNCPKTVAKTERSREMTKTLIVVTTLVATFTFSAVYNIPGGFKNGGDDEGTAALHNKVAFKLFMIFDAIAMASSIISTVVLFWTSWETNDKTFMDLLAIALPLTWVSLMAMGLAFVTGLYAVLSNVKWLAIVVFTIGCTFPAFITFFIPLLFATAMTFRSSDTYNAALSVNPNVPLSTRMGSFYMYGLKGLLQFIAVPLVVCFILLVQILKLMKKIIKLVLRC